MPMGNQKLDTTDYFQLFDCKVSGYNSKVTTLVLFVWLQFDYAKSIQSKITQEISIQSMALQFTFEYIGANKHSL